MKTQMHYEMNGFDQRHLVERELRELIDRTLRMEYKLSQIVEIENEQ